MHVDGYGVYTNNPPCGAMRGFGAVQAASRYEAQMDKLAAALGMDPVELRLPQRDARGLGHADRPGVDCRGAGGRVLQPGAAMPLPPAARPAERDLRDCRAGCANTTHGEGVGAASATRSAYKNVGFSEGFDDYSTARVRLEMAGGEPVATVHTAAAEVGQGLVTVEQQICPHRARRGAGRRRTRRTPRSAPAGPPRRPGRPT